MKNITIDIRVENLSNFGIVTIYSDDNYYSATMSIERILKILSIIEGEI